MFIWQVWFDYEFRSSSGMSEYTNTYNNVEKLVVTQGDSIGDVEKAIQSGMDNQSYLKMIRKVTFIGKSFNDFFEYEADIEEWTINEDHFWNEETERK